MDPNSGRIILNPTKEQMKALIPLTETRNKILEKLDPAERIAWAKARKHKNKRSGRKYERRLPV